MSSDYRPRGGNTSSGSSNGGPRRRRGGRGRSRPGQGEHRSHSNGISSTTAAPKKKVGPLAKLIGWLTGKSKPESKTTNRVNAPRSEFKERERAPRAERSPRSERPQEAAVPQEIVSPKLYVGNLAYEAAESDLFDLFSKVGAVKNVEIAMDRHANRSKGFGFVEMESVDTAKEAATKLNRTDFMGRQIVVSGAKLEKRSINPREEQTDNSSSSSSPDVNV